MKQIPHRIESGFNTSNKEMRAIRTDLFEKKTTLILFLPELLGKLGTRVSTRGVSC
jgi:hypothetical protein